MPSSTLRLMFAAMAFCGLLAACDTAPPRPTYPDIRFTNEPPLRLDVAAVDIRNDFRPSFQPPNVEHLFPVPPARGAENWARDRLQVVGSQNRARFTIVNASVVEVELKKQTEGVRGALTTEPAQRYDASLEVKLEILDGHGLALRTITVKAGRSHSVLEGITPNQRDQEWYAMTKDLLTDMDKQLEAEMQANFNLYLR